jgi:hypothetical protein
VKAARLAWLLLGLAACLGGSCARRASLPAGTEIRIHGQRGILAVAPDDARGPALLAEARALLAAARPGAGALGRRDVGLALARGALEFRFAAEQRFATATGDSLTAWRLLLLLGMEPPPPGGEKGLLLLLGSPDYDPRPLVSSRPRGRLLAILEGR